MAAEAEAAMTSRRQPGYTKFILQNGSVPTLVDL